MPSMVDVRPLQLPPPLLLLHIHQHAFMLKTQPGGQKWIHSLGEVQHMHATVLITCALS